MRHDLRLAVPDVALLPNLLQTLQRLDQVPGMNEYERTPITADLEAQARRTWPYPARGFMAANGGYEALLHVLSTVIQTGDRILVEAPSTPRILDVAERVGGRPTLIECDREGPTPDSLTAGLALRPAALIMQPGPNNPTGRILTRSRAAVLRSLLGRHVAESTSTFLILEDDGLGALHDGAMPSMVATGLPGVHIRSYSKSHGPDLRLAVIEADQSLIERIHSFSAFGAGWSSRVLQQALAAMLADPSVDALVDHARMTYRIRRDSLLTGLRSRDIILPPPHGLLGLWVPVEDEQNALVTLAAHGVAALGGSKFSLAGSEPHIRVATPLLVPEDVDHVASAIADAVSLS